MLYGCLVNRALNLCTRTQVAGFQIYLCIAGLTEPIIQQSRSQQRTFARTFSASGLLHSSSQVWLFRLPMTSLSLVPLQGITSPYGSIKKVSKLISQGSRRFCP